MDIKPFDAICFGEILWDLLPWGEKPGGAPMNVAYHLQKLGLNASLISRTGNDERGGALHHLLSTTGIDTRFMQIDREHKTGIVNATVQANNEVTYDIVYPVAWDFIEWERALSDIVAQSSFFVYGSLAARHETSYRTLRQLFEAANTKVLDINLRPPYFTKVLVEELIAAADILKLNAHEVSLIAGWYNDVKEIKTQVQLVQERFSVPLILVTKGEEGALVCHEGRFSEHQGYSVKVADTVGSGDAFLAAFLYKMNKGGNIEDNLKFANALGAFIASKEGACPDYHIDEVSLLIQSLQPDQH